MPSKEFMERVLGEGALAAADETRMASMADEETGEEQPEEEQVEAEEPEAPEEAPEEEPGELAPPSEPEEAEEEEEPEEGDQEEQPEAHEDSFYVGRYRTREEAERGIYETKRSHDQAVKRAAEAERALAYYQGLAEGRVSESAGDFEEWADEQIENDPQGGMDSAVQAAIDSGDFRYVQDYLARWGEADPYAASVAHADFTQAMQQFQQQQQTPENAQRLERERRQEEQRVLDQVWADMTAEDSRLHKAENDIVRALKEDPQLEELARSGDPRSVGMALRWAYDRYRLENARLPNGSPRRVKSGDAERVQAEKLAATVSTGDVTSERRTSSPAVDPEFQEAFEYLRNRGQVREGY